MTSRRGLGTGTVVLLLVLAGCGGDSGADQRADRRKSASPVLRITAPAPGTQVSGDGATLDLAAEGVRIVAANGDLSGETAHYHVFVDRQPVPVGEVIPKEPGILHSADARVVVSGLSPGEHRFAVVLGDGVHRRLPGEEVHTRVVVKGP